MTEEVVRTIAKDVFEGGIVKVDMGPINGMLIGAMLVGIAAIGTTIYGIRKNNRNKREIFAAIMAEKGGEA